jgi:microcystin-dependent protein
VCDGSAVSRTTYANLFSVIGTTWGVGDGSTTFNIPDLRGVKLRGKDGGKGLDPDRASRGAIQAGTFTLSCTTVLSNSSVTTASTANLAPGMSISGTGIPANTVILSITNATTFVLGAQTGGTTVNATAAGTNTMTISNSATADFVGSYQSDQLQGHFHSTTSHGVVTNIGINIAQGDNLSSAAQSVTAGSNYTQWGVGSAAADGSNGTPRAGLESRSKNANVNYCIKY